MHSLSLPFAGAHRSQLRKMKFVILEIFIAAIILRSCNALPQTLQAPDSAPAPIVSLFGDVRSFLFKQMIPL